MRFARCDYGETRTTRSTPSSRLELDSIGNNKKATSISLARPAKASGSCPPRQRLTTAGVILRCRAPVKWARGDIAIVYSVVYCRSGIEGDAARTTTFASDPDAPLTIHATDPAAAALASPSGGFGASLRRAARPSRAAGTTPAPAPEPVPRPHSDRKCAPAPRPAPPRAASFQRLFQRPRAWPRPASPWTRTPPDSSRVSTRARRPCRACRAAWPGAAHLL